MHFVFDHAPYHTRTLRMHTIHTLPIYSAVRQHHRHKMHVDAANGNNAYSACNHIICLIKVEEQKNRKLFETNSTNECERAHKTVVLVDRCLGQSSALCSLYEHLLFIYSRSVCLYSWITTWKDVH